MSRRAIFFLLFAFILIDVVYSFVQHHNMALDGDMAAIILPAENYQQVMQDPFGITTLSGEKYGAPNRFFIHWPMSAYFLHIPLCLQYFMDPVDSIYLACALAKTAIQILLLTILAAFITAHNKFCWRDWLLALAFVTPFFQTGGYNLQMGLVESSMTYSFFYPFPLAILGCFFLPFYRSAVQNAPMRFSLMEHIILVFLSVALPFSGPLVPAVVLLVCPVVLIKKWVRQFTAQTDRRIFQKAFIALSHIPTPMLFYFSFISLGSLWSLYIGQFNIENPVQAAPLSERYINLLRGLGSIFTQKMGLPLLSLGIASNLLLLRKKAPTPMQEFLFSWGKWLAIFAAAYLLLLPLGGYRSYRPLVVRHDTVMPVTLCLVFYFCLTAFFLFRKIEWEKRRWYALGMVVFGAIFTAADLPDFERYKCEWNALETIAHSTKKLVKLNNDCPVMAWHKITDPAASELNVALLRHWRVTNVVEQYFSK